MCTAFIKDLFSQLSGVGAESVELKACLSHGRRLIPTLAAHFDPYSGGGNGYGQGGQNPGVGVGHDGGRLDGLGRHPPPGGPVRIC